MASQPQSSSSSSITYLGVNLFEDFKAFVSSVPCQDPEFAKKVNAAIELLERELQAERDNHRREFEIAKAERDSYRRDLEIAKAERDNYRREFEIAQAERDSHRRELFLLST